ncbi:MAG: DUF1573 domain-containing protein [Roseimicrobium sp.]
MTPILAIVAIMGMTMAHADLVWEQPVQEFQRLPEDKELTVNFAFKNTGSAPISIVKVSASCGSCTTATPPEKPIQPGEKGTMPVRFTFGTRRGLQSKSLSVMTDDMQTTTLAFKCLITDDPVTLQASIVTWKVGDKVESKTVNLTIAQSDKVKVLAVASTNPHVTAMLSPLKEAGKYAVTIQPADTSRADRAQVFVQTNFPPEGPRAYTINVQIK